MKKFIYIGLILILIFTLIGCNKVEDIEEANNEIENENEVDQVQEEMPSIMDYYPFEANLIMDYEGEGIEYAEQTRIVEYLEGNKIQIKIINSGTTFVKVLEYNNGELKEVFGEGEFYHIENMLKANRNTDNIILKEPLEVGTSWSNSDGDIMEITSLNKEIETPLGLYETLEVTKQFKNGSIEKNYYGRNIGFVGSIYEDGDFQVKTLLKSIENHGQNILIEAYYPSSDEITTKYIDQNLVFNTNDNIEVILEDILKNPSSNKLMPSISEETKINRINLDRNTWTLNVDFSEELVKDMNAGSTYEFEILRSIVNTLGRFYDVDKVYITKDQIPYESGHIQMQEGEYFEVDTQGLEKIEE